MFQWGIPVGLVVLQWVPHSRIWVVWSLVVCPHSVWHHEGSHRYIGGHRRTTIRPSNALVANSSGWCRYPMAGSTDQRSLGIFLEIKKVLSEKNKFMSHILVNELCMFYSRIYSRDSKKRDRSNISENRPAM